MQCLMGGINILYIFNTAKVIPPEFSSKNKIIFSDKKKRPSPALEMAHIIWKEFLIIGMGGQRQSLVNAVCPHHIPGVAEHNSLAFVQP